MQFLGLCFCCLWVALSAALELVVQQAPAESGSGMATNENRAPHREDMKRQLECITSCCFRGRPLPLRWGSGADWAVLGWGDGSLVPLLLMPGSVHLRQRAWASNPRRSCLESFEDRRPECQRRDSVKEKKTLLLSVIIPGYETHFVWAQRRDWIQTGA